LEAFRLQLISIQPFRRSHPERNHAGYVHPANGYDRKEFHQPDVSENFFAAQAARNERLVSQARERVAAIEKGRGKYKRDEPFDVPEANARALQSDTSLISRSRSEHPLLKSDGTTAKQIVKSVRPMMGQENSIGGYEQYTVRGFLAGEAIRTTADYGMTESSITGVDWPSSTNSAPSNIEGIKVPVLIMSMTCHYLMVPDEIIYDHASKDKQLVSTSRVLRMGFFAVQNTATR
jgi:hypothetical protein